MPLTGRYLRSELWWGNATDQSESYTKDNDTLYHNAEQNQNTKLEDKFLYTANRGVVDTILLCIPQSGIRSIRSITGTKAAQLSGISTATSEFGNKSEMLQVNLN